MLDDLVRLLLPVRTSALFACSRLLRDMLLLRATRAGNRSLSQFVDAIAPGLQHLSSFDLVRVPVVRRAHAVGGYVGEAMLDDVDVGATRIEVRAERGAHAMAELGQ